MIPSLFPNTSNDLIYKIDILYGDPIVDATGAPVDDPSTLSPPQTNVFKTKVPAGITALFGRELDLAQRMVAEVSHRILIRWRAGIRAGMFLKWHGRTFRVTYQYDKDESQRFLYLLAIEISDGVQ